MIDRSVAVNSEQSTTIDVFSLKIYRTHKNAMQFECVSFSVPDYTIIYFSAYNEMILGWYSAKKEKKGKNRLEIEPQNVEIRKCKKWRKKRPR